MSKTFDVKVMTQIGVFCAVLEKATKTEFAERFANLKAPTFYPEMGNKYTRIVHQNDTQRSVTCFVRNSDGAILKAASWKAPVTKSPRGNIFNDNCDVGVNVSWLGARYLK